MSESTACGVVLVGMLLFVTCIPILCVKWLDNVYETEQKRLDAIRDITR